MRTTNRLISLFAAILTAATMLADVVYEPLIVDSGFNRDVIAENIAVLGSTQSGLYPTGSQSCFATQSVIAIRNADRGYTEDQYKRTVASGWPDNYTDTIRCDTVWGADAIYEDLYKDVFWLLAPYNGNNALCIRPDAGMSGEGTLKFKKIGCYNRLFFLLVSLKTKNPDPRVVTTTIFYTNGDSTSTTFTISQGLRGEAHHKARMTNIHETEFKKNKVWGSEHAYAGVFDVEVSDTMLIDRIRFKNPIDFSSVTIFAITGRTANIAAPKEETAQVSNIGEHSFEACWAAVEDAVSYRLDVASDSAFQHILEKYNNKVIDDGTCAEVKNLVEDSAYYWRIRSVNEEGGQSASSAPKRVKTAGGEIPETAETNEDIESELIPHLNKLYSTFKIDRTLWRDGYYNTLCLPFNMTPGEIAVSPLAGATVYKYVRADKIGNNQLNIEVADTTGIRAGVPYLIQWPDMGDIIPAPLEFHNVTISTNVGQTIGGPDDIRFVGNIGIATLVEEDDNNLFLGANNVLYWPNKDQNRMKGFRAYFQVPTTGANAVKKNTPARIVMRQETPTDIDQISNQQSPFSNKILRNGQILIIRDGQTYNLLGGKISPKP